MNVLSWITLLDNRLAMTALFTSVGNYLAILPTESIHLTNRL